MALRIPTDLSDRVVFRRHVAEAIRTIIAGTTDGHAITGDSSAFSGLGSASISPGGVVVRTVVTKTTTYTATTSDSVILCDANGGAFTVTLPAAADETGLVLDIKAIDVTGGSVEIDGDGSETIDGALTYTLTVQYQSLTIVSDGSNWHIL